MFADIIISAAQVEALADWAMEPGEFVADVNLRTEGDVLRARQGDNYCAWDEDGYKVDENGVRLSDQDDPDEDDGPSCERCGEQPAATCECDEVKPRRIIAHANTYPTELGELCVLPDGRLGRYDGVEERYLIEDRIGRDHPVCLIRVYPLGNPTPEIIEIREVVSAEEWQSA